jgi:hypothetical protein
MELSVQVMCLEYLECLRQILLSAENEAPTYIIGMTAQLMLYGFCGNGLAFWFWWQTTPDESSI